MCSLCGESDHEVDVLESHSQRVDPTGTNVLRTRYAQRLRGAFADLNTRIREGIIQKDVFGLTVDVLENPPPMARFDSDRRKEELFSDWLDTQIDDDILETIDKDDNTFIRSAYSRGIKDADADLAELGVDTPDEELSEIFNSGVHQESIQDLYTQNFTDLEDITQEMSRQIGEELSTGFAEGKNPEEIARQITDRVDKIGKTRATTLAQTQIVSAYTDATLNRYEQTGIRQVEIQAEWLTAQDERVCPVCMNLSGTSRSIQEARTGSIELSESDVKPFMSEEQTLSNLIGEFPVKPPAHPRCRCRIIPTT